MKMFYENFIENFYTGFFLISPDFTKYFCNCHSSNAHIFLECAQYLSGNKLFDIKVITLFKFF